MNDFEEITARITASIKHIPDRLTPKVSGLTSIRADYSRLFARCVLGHEADPDFFSALPFQVSLLTDPHIYIVGGGFLVLDHPTKPEQFLSAIESKYAHVVDLNSKCSLYASRHPRLIACPRRGEKIEMGWMINRLMSSEFRGPFAVLTKEAS